MNRYEAKQADRRRSLTNRAEKIQQESNTIYRRAREDASAIPFGGSKPEPQKIPSTDSSFKLQVS